MSRPMDIIAIQVSALQVGDQFGLQFTKVFDADLYDPERPLSEGREVDRAYWVAETHPGSLAMVDQMLSFIPAGGVPPRVTYTTEAISVATAGRRFARFTPRRALAYCVTHLQLRDEDRAAYVTKLEAAGILAGPRCPQMWMRLAQHELAAPAPVIRGPVAKAEEESRS
jgi:hypothetical protein